MLNLLTICQFLKMESKINDLRLCSFPKTGVEHYVLCLVSTVFISITFKVFYNFPFDSLFKI